MSQTTTWDTSLCVLAGAGVPNSSPGPRREKFKGADPESNSLYAYLDQRLKETEGKGNVNGIKPCPRCQRPIEKNGACKHMTCGAHYGGSVQVKSMFPALPHSRTSPHTRPTRNF